MARSRRSGRREIGDRSRATQRPAAAGPAGSVPSTRPAVPDRPTPGEWTAAAVILAAGVALRVVELGDLRAWDVDEAHMVLVAQGSFGEIVTRLQTEAYPPLWFFAEHLWTALLGVSEAAARSLSVVFALLTVPVVFLAGRRVAGERPALYAAVLLAVAPLHVFYAREARMYALLVLCAALVFWLLHRAVDLGRRRDWVALGAALAAAAWVHTYGLFLFAATAACIVLPSYRARAKPLLATLGAAFAAHAPWLPTILGQAQTGGESWMADFFAALPGWAAPLRSLELLGAGGAYPVMNYALAEHTALRWPAVALYALALGWFAWTPRIRRPLKFAAALFLLLPLALPWAYSLASHPIYVAGRYDVMVIPVYVLVLGLALDALRPALRYPLLVSFLALSAWTLYPLYARSPQLPGPARAAHILENAAPGDLVLATDIVGQTLRIEFLEANAPLEVRSFPAVTDEHPGWVDYDRLDRVALPAEADALSRSLRAAGRTVWLVLPVRTYVTDTLASRLERDFAVDPRRSAGALQVVRLVPRP